MLLVKCKLKALPPSIRLMFPDVNQESVNPSRDFSGHMSQLWSHQPWRQWINSLLDSFFLAALRPICLYILCRDCLVFNICVTCLTLKINVNHDNWSWPAWYVHQSNLQVLPGQMRGMPVLRCHLSLSSCPMIPQERSLGSLISKGQMRSLKLI